MKRLSAIVAAVFVACGASGPEIVYQDTAPIEDIYVWLDATTQVLIEVLDKHTAEAVMDVYIRVYAEDHEFNGLDNTIGLYYPELDLIMVRRLGDSVQDTALPHEIFEHRLPHILTGEPNRDHADYWHEFGTNLARMVGQ